MLSVMEVKKRLPRDFIEELYNLNSPLVADKILAGMAGKRNTTCISNKKCNRKGYSKARYLRKGIYLFAKLV